LEKGNGGEAVVVCEEIILADAKLEVEHIEELAFDAADVSLPEDAGTERPVDVLECRVVQILMKKSGSTLRINAARKGGGGEAVYLGRDNERTEEDPLEDPLLKGDVEVRLGTVDIDEGGEHDRRGDICA
jgi:hypothetical protein